VLAGVADHEVGSASGVLNAVQQLAGAVGIAAIGTVYFSVLASDGIQHTFELALWIDAGLIAVTAALVCLLPTRRPRGRARLKRAGGPHVAARPHQSAQPPIALSASTWPVPYHELWPGPPWHCCTAPLLTPRNDR
jgi:hypothetical protein